jgi:hypothetical protein
LCETPADGCEAPADEKVDWRITALDANGYVTGTHWRRAAASP